MRQTTKPDLMQGEDGRRRCYWQAFMTGYGRYHDTEWGRPVADDIRLFEKLCLEGFQSGLSWLTVLRKRENFRRAFAGFDFETVSGFTDADIDRLMVDAGIVRHRGKIASVVNNARRAMELRQAFGSLAAYFWAREPDPAGRPARITRAFLEAHPHSPASTAIARDLKRRGWTFVGPTTVHAFMQAVGLVNDHVEGCAFRADVEEERRRFARPRRPDRSRSLADR